MFRGAFLQLLLARLHSQRCQRGNGKPHCRLPGMVTQLQGRRLSAEGIAAAGPVQARCGDQIRGDPNSWAVEHLSNRFSRLHHQNLRASVDTVAAHHNVFGKQCCTATAEARGWSHTSSAELGCWACSAVKGRLGIPPPWLAPDPNTSPDLRSKPGSVSVYGQKPSRYSQKVSLTVK